MRRAALLAATALVGSVLTTAVAPTATGATLEPCPTVDPVTHQVTGLVADALYTGCDMSGADLSNRWLDGVWFGGSNFEGADFRGSYLSFSNLTGTLTGARFDDALFEGTRLEGELSFTTFQGAVLASPSTPNLITGDMYGADLRGVDATGLRFTHVKGSPKLDSAVMIGADLSGSDLDLATLVNTDLTGATLALASLAGTDMRGAILTDALLYFTTIAGADLTGASLAGVRSQDLAGSPVLPPDWMAVDGRLVGPGANLREQTFTGSALAGANLTGADLTGASFSGADMTGADLTRATIFGASFGANLTGATGLSTARYNGATTWVLSTCPDGKAWYLHVGQACTGAADVSAPKASIASPGAFVWPSGPTALVKVTATDDSSSAADMLYRLRWRTSTSGASTLSWSSWQTGPWYPYDGGSQQVTVTPGKRTCVQVQARDLAENTSAWGGERCFDVPYDPAFFEQVPYWQGRSGEGWSSFVYTYTSTKGAIAYTTAKRYVRQLGVVATTCPTCGSVALYVGSTKVGSLSLTRSTTTRRALLLLPRLPSRLYGQVKIVVTSSSGRLVRLDDVAVTAV